MPVSLKLGGGFPPNLASREPGTVPQRNEPGNCRSASPLLRYGTSPGSRGSCCTAVRPSVSTPALARLVSGVGRTLHRTVYGAYVSFHLAVYGGNFSFTPFLAPTYRSATLFLEVTYSFTMLFMDAAYHPPTVYGASHNQSTGGYPF